MTEAQMRELVSATFATGWRAAQPDVDFALENEGRTTPAVGAGSFALLTIVMTTATQRTQGAVGNRRVQRDGWLQIKLWTPANAGAAGAAGLADAARSLLEMVSLPAPDGSEPVTTQAAITMAGAVDGRWYMSLVRIPFWYAETK